jgi:SAM-dependent methyltransferase
MLKALQKRAKKAGVLARIHPHICSQNSLGLQNFAGKIDFALIFAVVHEVPDKDRLYSEVSDLIKPGGKLLIAEPRGHVSEEAFNETVSSLEKHGFKTVKAPEIKWSLSVLMQKN